MAESHTATQQWQSFELRMRQRRAQRCMLRAAAAMDAGVLDAAREALDEARHLAPHDPELAPLVARLTAAEAVPIDAPPFDLADVPPTAPELPLNTGTDITPSEVDAVVDPYRRSRRVPHRWAAAAVIVLLCGVAGWGWATWEHARTIAPTEARDVAAPPAVPAAPSRAATEPAPAPAIASSETAAPHVGTTGAETVAAAETPAPSSPPPVAVVESPVTIDKAAARVARVPDVTVQTPAAPPAPRSDTSAPIAAPSVETLAGIARPSTESQIPIDVPIGDAAAKPAPPPPLPPLAEPPARAATSAAAPAPMAIPDDRLVRGVLTRYEAAYSSLDARAAHAVWPSLDSRALARAFEGLSSQTIALGTCSVRVNGASAIAECDGRATWTPRVGGGPQTASRRWRFDLARTDGGWVIQRATMR